MAIKISRELDDRVLARTIEHNINANLCNYYQAKALPREYMFTRITTGQEGAYNLYADPPKEKT